MIAKENENDLVIYSTFYFKLESVFFIVILYLQFIECWKEITKNK